MYKVLTVILLQVRAIHLCCFFKCIHSILENKHVRVGFVFYFGCVCVCFLKNKGSEEESFFDFHCWISSSLLSVVAE